GGRATYGVPVIPYQSAGFTEAARTRTSTPSLARSGLSSSWSSSTLGEPYLLRTIAFIAFPLPSLAYSVSLCRKLNVRRKFVKEARSLRTPARAHSPAPP